MVRGTQSTHRIKLANNTKEEESMKELSDSSAYCKVYSPESIVQSEKCKMQKA